MWRKADGKAQRYEPLVGFLESPSKWTQNKFILLIAAVVLTYIGIEMAAGFYYLLFELWPPMTEWWHHLVPDSELRHNIRSAGQGLLGGLLGQTVVWNHFRKIKPSKNWLDRFEIWSRIPNLKDDRRLSVWQLIMTTPLALTYAMVGFFGAREILSAIHHNLFGLASFLQWIETFLDTSLPAPPRTVWNWIRSSWNSGYEVKLIGYSASFFFGRRPARGVFDDLQLFFVEQRLVANKPLRWYHLPTFQARYNGLKGQHITATEFGGWFKFVLYGGFAVGAALFITGEIVMIFIA
jgi:hypothetical protein